MTDKLKNLSNTTRALLTVAAMRDGHLIRPPQLPIAAVRQVLRSLLNSGLADKVPVDDANYAWRTGGDGRVLTLRATGLGLARVAGDAGAAIRSPVRQHRHFESILSVDGPAHLYNTIGFGHRD